MNEHDLSRPEAAAAHSILLSKGNELPVESEEQRLARISALEEKSKVIIAERRRADAKMRFETCCPADMRSSDWDHPKLKPYRKQIDSIVGWSGGPKGLLAFGESGRGKTRAMWALMDRLCCKEGREVRMYTAADWFGQLQEQVKYGHDDARGWIEAVSRRPLVFIDDFGQEAIIASKSDWALSWFFRFLDIRVGEKLPLFLTTNLSSKQLTVRGGNVRGDPMVRRLMDICEVVIF